MREGAYGYLHAADEERTNTPALVVERDDFNLSLASVPSASSAARIAAMSSGRPLLAMRSRIVEPTGIAPPDGPTS